MGIFAKDRLFKNNKNYPKVFKFNALVSQVFDNMIKRSIPFYYNIQKEICWFAGKFIKPNTNIYDLGCSTGYTVSKIAENFKKQNITLWAVDYSSELLARAKDRLKKYKNINYINCDLNKEFKLSGASFVVANLVLQFLKYSSRKKLLKNIYQGLQSGGCFIMVEKLRNDSVLLDNLFIDRYYFFKQKKGYSKEEIIRKKQALKNILSPLTMQQNIELLTEAGFTNIEVFFRWFNFCGFIAVK